jgi:hypothetical protein
MILVSCLTVFHAETTDPPSPPRASPLFDMSFETNKDTWDVFTEQGLTIKILIKNTGVTPIAVTVTTDSDHCTSSSEQDTGTLGVDREAPVVFQFNWGRELKRNEEFRINFTGKITGDPIGTSYESLTAHVRSAKVLDARILDFQNDASGQKGGEEVNFRTQVMNTGNVPATFMVKLFDGKNEVENNTKNIDANGTDYIDILWVAKEGKHNFQAKVYVIIGYVNNNPNGDAILELLGESSAVVVEIEAGNILTEGVDNNLVLIVVFVILLVVVIIVFLNRKRIKKMISTKRGKK